MELINTMRERNLFNVASAETRRAECRCPGNVAYVPDIGGTSHSHEMPHGPQVQHATGKMCSEDVCRRPDYYYQFIFNLLPARPV